MNKRTIRFSVSMNFVDKTPLTKNAFSEEFNAVEGTIEDIGSAIQQDGWTFGYVFHNNKRSKANFLSADFIAVDVDHGMKIPDALAHPIVKNFCSLFYVTPSHTPDKHKFRLVFVLPRTITKAKDITAAARALCRRLGGDMAATDAARVFHGHKGCEPLLFNNEITADFLDELIKDGSVIQTKASIASAGATANRNAHEFKSALQLRLKDGSIVQASQIDESTTIYCPFHHDERPSAFISKNNKGSRYIHCSACQMTWWIEGAVKATFDFYGFERAIEEIRSQLLVKNIETPFGSLKELTGQSIPSVIVTNTKNVELDAVEEGITFVKSPKGSGKTTYLAKATKRIISNYASLEEYEEATDYEFELPIRSNETVLLIGHRRALIGELSGRLGLNCYLDDSSSGKDALSDRRRRYGVCLDSLANVRQESYDVILIDEVEQVLAHFMSSTIGEKREDIFRLFARLINSAKKVVALDADLGWLSFITLTTLTQQAASKIKISSQPRPVRIYFNNSTAANRTLHLYSNPNQLIQNISACVVDGKRVFVASNSKEKIKSLEHGLRKIFKDLSLDIFMMSITSDNSQDNKTQEFIKNIKTEILKYNVILSSPSLGTGIDITFENDAQEIDCVFGIFENRINSHFEIDQQLARVRHPKEVHVWISPQKFQFETEFNVVKHDYMHDRLLEVIDTGVVKDADKFQRQEIEPFYQLAAMILAAQRASKNDLKKNFLEYKTRQGWTIVSVQVDDSMIELGKEIKKYGDISKKEKYVESVVNALPLNRVAFNDIVHRLEWDEGPVSEEEAFALAQTRIELFYGHPISEQLVRDDDGGKLRAQVQMYELLQTLIASQGVLGDVDPSPKNMLIKNRGIGAQLLHLLFSKTPIYRNGKFDSTVIYTKESLTDFAAEAKRLDVFVQTHLNVHLRADIETKPTTHLHILLRMIGLDIIEPQKPTVLNGVKSYHYAISGQSLLKMNNLVDRRKCPKLIGWDFVNSLHGFKYTLEEIAGFIE